MAQEAPCDKLSSGQTFYFYLHPQCSPLRFLLAEQFFWSSLAESRDVIHILLSADENFP